MTVSASTRVALLVLATVAGTGLLLPQVGCKSNALEPLAFAGTLGQPMPATLFSNTLSVSGTIDGQPVMMLIDTGAPVVLLPGPSFPGRPVGESDLAAELLGLRIPALPVALQSSSIGNPFADDDGMASAAFGLLGGSFLGHFVVTLDYAAATVQLDEQLPVVVPEGEEEVSLRRIGGGSITFATGARVPTSATRLVLPVEIDGVVSMALLDTGTSTTLVSAGSTAASARAARPRLEGAQLAGFGGLIDITYTRVERMNVGGAGVSGPLVAVYQDDQLLDSLREETGEDLQMILGGTFLRSFVVKLDPILETLRLSPNPAASALPPVMVSGLGFFVRKRVRGGLEVSSVHPGGPAALAGLQVGDEILDLDGSSAVSLGEQRLNLRLLTSVGRQLTVTVLGAGRPTPTTVTLTSVDLVPAL